VMRVPATTGLPIITDGRLSISGVFIRVGAVLIFDFFPPSVYCDSERLVM
jgi:hypothetical protein